MTNYQLFLSISNFPIALFRFCEYSFQKNKAKNFLLDFVFLRIVHFQLSLLLIYSLQFIVRNYYVHTVKERQF